MQMFVLHFLKKCRDEPIFEIRFERERKREREISRRYHCRYGKYPTYAFRKENVHRTCLLFCLENSHVAKLSGDGDTIHNV